MRNSLTVLKEFGPNRGRNAAHKLAQSMDFQPKTTQSSVIDNSDGVSFSTLTSRLTSAKPKLPPIKLLNKQALSQVLASTIDVERNAQ